MKSVPHRPAHTEDIEPDSLENEESLDEFHGTDEEDWEEDDSFLENRFLKIRKDPKSPPQRHKFRDESGGKRSSSRSTKDWIKQQRQKTGKNKPDRDIEESDDLL